MENMELPQKKSNLTQKQYDKLEKVIVLPCLECKELYVHEQDSLTGQGVFNFFCSGRCEDNYA